MYDAIVVGARAAGSPTAMLLARAGLKVLLVDRATFPSDTLSTHQLTLSAVARLQRWNLLDRLIASGAPPIHRLTLKLGPLTIAGGFAPLDGLSTVYAPRRTVLDKLLVDAAVEAGAELREGYSVQRLLYDATGRVCGIRGRSADGAGDEIRGRIVIGADGTRSQVARWAEAPAYNTKPSLSYGYYAYFSGVPMDNAAQVTIGAGEAVIASPTHGDQTIVIVQGARDGFHAFREDIEGNFYRMLALSPALNEQVRAGRRESRFFGTAELPNGFRVPYGRGWALVGDAGYFKDPTLGHGIGDGFRDAELLANGIITALSEGAPPEAVLPEYQATRDAAVMPIYELITQLASFAPPQLEMVQLLAAVAQNPQATSQFLGMLSGSVPVPAFFSPENVGAIMADSQALAA